MRENTDGLRLHDDARRDLVPRSAEDVVLALARESLAHRDEYVAAGYVMEPMPFEAEVRALLRPREGEHRG